MLERREDSQRFGVARSSRLQYFGPLGWLCKPRSASGVHAAGDKFSKARPPVIATKLLREAGYTSFIAQAESSRKPFGLAA